MTERVARTYRLSTEVLEIIEQRDKQRYPNATEFIEAKILAPAAGEEAEILGRIAKELESLRVVRTRKPKEEKGFPVSRDPFTI